MDPKNPDFLYFTSFKSTKGFVHKINVIDGEEPTVILENIQFPSKPHWFDLDHTCEQVH